MSNIDNMAKNEEYLFGCNEKYRPQIEPLLEFIRQYFIANPSKDFVEITIPDMSKDFLSSLYSLNVEFYMKRVTCTKNLYRFYSDLWPFY